ncbi:MAG: thiamine phosphate synthase [Pseudomonadota bacterium]|nr:thiamine phosphate synthase [Pseudomonadota bacterium]
MNIPKIYPITPSYLSTNQLLTSIKNLKRDGLNLFLYRRKELYKSVIEAELSLITKLCLDQKIHLILNSYHAQETKNNFSGIHLTSLDLRKEEGKFFKRDNLLGISCHSEADIIKAESLKADYIFLSPIKETTSHQEIEGIGWEKFSYLSNKTNLPTYALGGLKREDLKVAESYGAYGVAGISNFWNT